VKFDLKSARHKIQESYMKLAINVIITCYKEGELILDAVNSALTQSLLPQEIIIVNDASEDQTTLKICQQLEKYPNVQLIYRTENGGPSVARNDGFRAASGDILVPLDADDILPERALEHILHAFTENPNTDFLYGNYSKQNHPNDSQIVNPGDISLSRMLKSRRFSPTSQWTLIGTAPLRKKLWESLGECDPLLGAEDLHDLEFWIRAISSGCQYRYIPEVIYIWRKYLGGNSRQITPLSWARIAQKHFDVYCQVGLEYRAYELLLLGSKWSGQSLDASDYTQKLIRCVLKGQFRLSTFIALIIPAPLLKKLTAYAGRRR
jgi:glycosyltransferase involved in cell wall biosynthesis